MAIDVEEPDKQWRISTETLIRAKSVRGYRTNNRKWTENKFKVIVKVKQFSVAEVFVSRWENPSQSC